MGDQPTLDATLDRSPCIDQVSAQEGRKQGELGRDRECFENEHKYLKEFLRGIHQANGL